MEVVKDIRGAIYEIMDRPKHINLITIRRGFARGGHSHNYSEMFMLVEGAVQFIEPKRIKCLIHGESVVTTPDVPHCIYATDDSVLVEVRDGGIKFKSNEDPNLRAFVNYMMSKSIVKNPKCSKCGRFHKTVDHQEIWKSKKRLL